jgi:hypothetical protein
VQTKCLHRNPYETYILQYIAAQRDAKLILRLRRICNLVAVFSRLFIFNLIIILPLSFKMRYSYNLRCICTATPMKPTFLTSQYVASQQDLYFSLAFASH